jgi:hypothetical protein
MMGHKTSNTGIEPVPSARQADLLPLHQLDSCATSTQAYEACVIPFHYSAYGVNRERSDDSSLLTMRVASTWGT